MRYATLAALLLISSQTASAQPMPGRPRQAELRHDRGEAARSAAQVQDDKRDLMRFQATLNAFDQAVARRDTMGVRGALTSFVQQGRAEVAEQTRELNQAQREVVRSGAELMRDRNRKDARDLRDDRRDAARENAALVEEQNLLGELERTVAAEYAWGPQVQILIRARQIMVRFVELARAELQRSRTELREDKRELREDRRGIR